MSESVERFREAQSNGEYEQALAEIQRGRKMSHWIWYIFPQVRGLGMSDMAYYYGIASAEEAAAYVADATLMSHLVEISKALLACQGTAEEILGGIDAMKVRSCTTLFELFSDDPVFAQVLDKFYAGERDARTLEIVEGWKAEN